MINLANELFRDYFDCYKSGWTTEQLSKHPFTKSRNIFFHVTSHANLASILEYGLLKGIHNGVYLAKHLDFVLSYGRKYIDSINCPIIAVNLYDHSISELNTFQEYPPCDATILYPKNIVPKYIIGALILPTNLVRNK